MTGHDPIDMSIKLVPNSGPNDLWATHLTVLADVLVHQRQYVV